MSSHYHHHGEAGDLVAEAVEELRRQGSGPPLHGGRCWKRWLSITGTCPRTRSPSV